MTGLIDRLARSFREHAERPALTVAGPSPESLTYAELWERAEKIADKLLRGGLDRGGFVIFQMRRGPGLVEGMLGTLLAGGVFSVLDEKSRWPQIRHAQRASRASVVVLDGASLLHLDVEHGGARDLPSPVCVDVEVQREKQRFEELHANGLVSPWRDPPPEAPEQAPWRTIDLDPGCCLFTSGSTGVPKGVLIGRGDLLARAETEIADYKLVPGERVLNLLPYSFDVGLNQLFSSLLAGAELVVLRSWLPAEIASAVTRHAIAGVSAVPAIWYGVLAAGAAMGPPLSRLRYLTISGGNMAPASLEALRLLLPRVGIYKTYGQTELFRATMLRPEEFTPERWSTVGRAVSGCEVFIADEDGRRVGAGQAGEVVHRGVGTMLRYLGDPRGTARKLRRAPWLLGDPESRERLVFTGDIGSLDKDGYLTLLGRRDTMIKSSGYRIYPAEVENALRAHAEVLEAAVVGVEDAKVGQRVVAVVVPKRHGGDVITSLERHARAMLPAYMVPQTIHLRDELPLGPSGKVQYEILRKSLE